MKIRQVHVGVIITAARHRGYTLRSESAQENALITSHAWPNFAAIRTKCGRQYPLLQELQDAQSDREMGQRMSELVHGGEGCQCIIV